MKHLKGFNTLNRTHAHRKALLRNLLVALLKNERIRTTVAKAKELRKFAERIITRAKVKDLHNIRMVNRDIKDEKILMKLFNEIAPRYVERNGGYTRIIKLAKRKGDGADMCYIELVEEKVKTKKKKASKEAKNDKKADKIAEKNAEKEKSSEAIKEEVKKEDSKKEDPKKNEKAEDSNANKK